MQVILWVGPGVEEKHMTIKLRSRRSAARKRPPVAPRSDGERRVSLPEAERTPRIWSLLLPSGFGNERRP